MASQWAAQLPVVTVPRATEPKRFTVILPFYENHAFLASHHLCKWAQWSETVRRHVSAIIVDDGSPVPLRMPIGRPLPLQVFRIQKDVPWNWIAARNIGAYHAPPGWMLLTDIDHVIPEATADAIIHGRHNPNVVYAFSRREHTGATIPPHSASFFMTREMFWRIGGYDEALSGHYGSDGDYRRRAAKVAPFQVLSDVLERWEYQSDSSTTRYQRKLPSDAMAVKRLITGRHEGWRPKTLTFAYTEIFGEA